MDKTTLYNIDEIRTALIQTTLDEIAFILKEKGYNPVNQIVGYLVSGDPGYITNYKDARKKILTLERNEILQVILREYLEI